MRAGGRRRRIRPAPLAIAVVLGLMVVLPVAGLAGSRVVEADLAGQLRQGQLAFQQGQKQLENGYKDQNPRLVKQASASFARSLSRFQEISRQTRRLEAASPGVTPAYVRTRVTSLAAVVEMGIHVDQAALTASRALLDAGIVAPPGTEQPPGAPAAGQLVGALEAVRQDLAQAQRAADRIDVGVVPAADQPAMRKALGELSLITRALDQLWPSLPAVLDLLGFNGPRTFLIEQVNPAELRSGGGFIGTVSLVRTDAGHVKLDRSLPVEAFDWCDAVGCVHPRPRPWQPGYVAPPPELAGPPLPPFSQLPAWSLEDSGFYPDFASNALIAESFANKQLNVNLNGVIAIDYYAVAPLLSLTGPIDVPEFKISLNAANFVDTVVGLDLARDPNHKGVIASAAAKIVSRLSHVQPDAVTRAIDILQDQVRTRHLQVYFNDPAVQAHTARLGVTDKLNPKQAGDFMMETEDNYGGSKANHFVERQFHLTLSRAGSTLHHQVVIDLVDRAPPEKAEIGPHYYSYLRLYVPAAASGLSIRSAASAEYAAVRRPGRQGQVPPPGSQVVGGWIFVLVGGGLDGRYEVTFSYDTPWAPGPDQAHTIYWQKQPGTTRDRVELSLSTGSRTFTASGDLSADRLVKLSDGGVVFTSAA
jgi:hypothetical protein